jgi:signal transduction histidine kinase
VKSRGIVWRLVAIQVLAWAGTGLLVVAFAPRLLLLEGSEMQRNVQLAAWWWGATVLLITAATVLAGRRARAFIHQLRSGADIDPRSAHSLYATPAQLATLDLVAALLVGAGTLLPPIRPQTNDITMQVEVVLLVMTMASVAVLPAYVALRASVAKVLERVPVEAVSDAAEWLGTPERRVARVRQRLLAAVVGPVAFVALGASLLVHAHLRALDTSSRQTDAAELAQGVLDAVDGDVRGRSVAIDVARDHGFDVRVWRSSALFSVSRNDEGRTMLTVPLSDGHALVEFETARLGASTGAYLGLALGAIALAGILGGRIGRAFADDVAIATRELEATGVADVLRGEHIRGDARFASVAALMAAADELGGVFRGFAGAQKRAIEARAANERTRALFLASMSHDLKAPLNAILGFAELVSRGSLSEEQRQSVAIIERRGRELLYLIGTILDAARAEAGELTIATEYTRVGDVVMPAVLGSRELTEGIDLHIVGEIQPGVPRILADPERLTQALTAIILVAARFAERGHIVVRAAMPSDGEQLRIDVDVVGRAVAAADREKVFDAFRNLDHARRHGSLGLGPLLARAIVELHGGSVAVETTEAGGSVFHIWVPSERGLARESWPSPASSREAS